ncbi:MAG: Phosphoglycerate mutase family protein [Microgenomates group bacterium GW2011_GWC1_37_8]|uniref:Phosphoglycerate mutase family protein n=1 Tax=Candidatus Woesebacteria bacterium GW2011_GWB1_38_8 TaxID=1618570 RepID=A0A0G0P5C0_9BACT|nr:MAG: Phosphoglycerate mutase family protein [Microgenomates group bacterium GW2011_GWC1_37_8]KKQ84521.1 MAG: Phosphoglycerate mutase family protein [Candidatus Woesebacteria bacterium GW2011_GWB1_38_8]
MEEDFSDWTGVERRVNPRENNIVVVSHAESIGNSEGIFQGQTFDSDLSELGKKQAKALAKRLKIFGARKIITSPLKGSRQTAQEVADTARCEIEINEKIIETNHGVWEGRHKVWIRENFTDIFDAWLQTPSQVRFPDGESFMETIQRTLDFLENTDFEPNSVVITHDNILRVMISLISNSDIDKMWEISLEAAALNFLEVNKVNQKNVFRVLKLNDTNHLVGLRNDVKKTHSLAYNRIKEI